MLISLTDYAKIHNKSGDTLRRLAERGGEVDTLRMADILLDEYRGGKLGRFTLEWPEG